MTTPIVMLILLMGPFVMVRLVSAITGRSFNARGAAAVGLGILFVFTGLGHFAQAEPMAQMLPPWVPARVPLIYLTGLLEFAAAAGFFLEDTRRLTGWVAAAILLLFFPLNVYAAINHVPMGGHEWGPAYLLIRAPLQIIILLWVYWFTIRPAGTGNTANTGAAES
jgi:uncharacterized membrane protein